MRVAFWFRQLSPLLLIMLVLLLLLLVLLFLLLLLTATTDECNVVWGKLKQKCDNKKKSKILIYNANEILNKK